MPKVVHIHINLSFAERIHNEFLNAGIDSRIISLRLNTPDTDRIKKAGKKALFISWLDGKLKSYLNRNYIREFGLFSYPFLGTDVSKRREVQTADIIYLHWIQDGFLNLSSIKQLAKLGKPVVFYMHDMWTITGGCHYSFTCEKYKTKCSNCQILPGNKINDLSSKEFKKKLKLFSKYKNLYFVSPSKWLYDCAKESALIKDKPVFHIPNILDNTIYKPFSKGTARQIINLNPAEIVIGFGAVSVSSPYKGWKYLQKALEKLPKDKNISIVLFGNDYNKEIADSIPFETKFLGYLKDEYSISLVLNAVDIFIAPSLADNLPYTIFEALSCGTPVVAFNVGGIPDMIDHKHNGYLAEFRNAGDIAEGIMYCINNHVQGYLLPGFETSSTITKHIALFDFIESDMKKRLS